MKKYAIIPAACLVAAASLTLFSSCQKDNSNGGTDEGGKGEVKELTLTKSSVEVKAGETETVEITSGNGGYSLAVADEGLLNATVNDNIISIEGIKAGATMVTVRDAAGKAKPLQVKVTKSGKNAIPTDVTYDIEVFSSEEGYSYNSGGWHQWDPTLTSKVTGTNIASVLDINNNADNAKGYNNDAVKEYISTFNPDEDVIFLGGYIADGKTADSGYSSVAVQVTNNDDSAHAGCKVVTVLASAISGALGWEDGKYYSRPGTAWYDPSDGSITLKDCEGGLYWGNSLTWKFKLNRKYTPSK